MPSFLLVYSFKMPPVSGVDRQQPPGEKEKEKEKEITTTQLLFPQSENSTSTYILTYMGRRYIYSPSIGNCPTSRQVPT